MEPELWLNSFLSKTTPSSLNVQVETITCGDEGDCSILLSHHCIVPGLAQLHAGGSCIYQSLILQHSAGGAVANAKWRAMHLLCGLLSCLKE